MYIMLYGMMYMHYINTACDMMCIPYLHLKSSLDEKEEAGHPDRKVLQL